MQYCVYNAKIWRVLKWAVSHKTANSPNLNLHQIFPLYGIHIVVIMTMHYSVNAPLPLLADGVSSDDVGLLMEAARNIRNQV